MRRQATSTVKPVNFSDIISNNVNFGDDSHSFAVRGICIVDDRNNPSNSDFIKLLRFINDINEKYPLINSITLSKFRTSTFKDLLPFVLTHKISNLTITNPQKDDGECDYDFVDNGYVPVKYYVDVDNLGKVPLNRLDLIPNSVATYNRSKLTDNQLAGCIENICNQIQRYAHNDLDRVLLLDKFLRENISYDGYIYTSSYRELSFQEQHMYYGRSIQSIITDKKGICAGISQFSQLILTQLGVNTKCVTGVWNTERHAWNEIEINGKWYSMDFTHNICFDRQNGLKYTLVKRPSSSHILADESLSDYHHVKEMDRSIVIVAQNRLNSVHIQIPDNILENQPDNNILAKRRRAVVGMSNPSTRRRRLATPVTTVFNKPIRRRAHTDNN